MLNRATRAILVLAVGLSIYACKNETNGPEVRDEPNPTPSSANTVIAYFHRPFVGDFPLLNYFDHDKPTGPGPDSGGYQLTWRGQRAIPGIHINGYDGHTGYDWVMPIGTPLLAVADGYVIFAGETEPSFCILENEINSTLVVAIRHPAPNGEIFTTRYVHMDRIDVQVGDQVTAGQHIGLSGATGCDGGLAHLHFNVYRLENTNSGSATYIDPYGWEGPGIDPWSQHPLGAPSVWLWLPGEAPSLVRW